MEYFYFAYGSNMDQEQIKERCPDAQLLGAAVLNNYKLAFTIFSEKRNCGCADVIKSEGDKVFGILYKLDKESIEQMDLFEGCNTNKYKRSTCEVRDLEGKIYNAEVYEVVEKSKVNLKTSKHYLGLMLKAAEEFNFPEDYREFLSTSETLD